MSYSKFSAENLVKEIIEENNRKLDIVANLALQYSYETMRQGLKTTDSFTFGHVTDLSNWYNLNDNDLIQAVLTKFTDNGYTITFENNEEDGGKFEVNVSIKVLTEAMKGDIK